MGILHLLGVFNTNITIYNYKQSFFFFSTRHNTYTYIHVCMFNCTKVSENALVY